MKQLDTEKLEKHCHYVSSLLDETEKLIFLWADKRFPWKKEFDRSIARMEDTVQRMPKNWYGLTLMQYVFGKLFGYPDNLRKFRKQNNDILTENQLKFVSLFSEKPWGYSCYRVKEKIKKDLFLIYDFTRDEEKILYSPGTEKNIKTGSKLFFSLLYDNGLCFQAAGPIFAFMGIRPDDFEYTAMELNPPLYQKAGSGPVILQNTVPFMCFSFYSDIPVMKFRNHTVYHHFTFTDLPPGKTAPPPEGITADSKKGVTRYFCDAPEGEPIFDQPILYIDKKRKLALLYGASKESYQKGAELFSDMVSFDKEPEWICSIVIIEALKDILPKLDSFNYYSEIFETREDKYEESKELEQVNRMTAEYIDAFNRGEPPPTAEYLAEKYNLPLDNVISLLDSVKETTEKYTLKVQGGIPGFSTPPPLIKQKFMYTFSENPLFTPDNNEKAEKLYKSMEKRRLHLLSKEDIPGIDFENAADLVERLHEETFKNPEEYPLLFFLYLLHEAGDRFRPVKEYMVEYMKTFWQLHFENREDIEWKEMETLIRFYFFNVLWTAGLVDTKPDDPGLSWMKTTRYNVRASDFFKTWLRWN